MRSDASLEVLSPSALAGPRCVVRSGHAANGPASAFQSLFVVPRVRGPSTIGVALAVFRSANTMRCSSKCGRRDCDVRPRVTPRGHGGWARVPAGPTSSLIARARIDRRNQLDHAHAQSVTSSATASMRSPLESRHAPSRSVARCSAPRPEPSRPDRSMGPSLPVIDRRRSWGSVAPFAGLIPLRVAAHL
jgi:hypothetical protein